MGSAEHLSVQATASGELHTLFALQPVHARNLDVVAFQILLEQDIHSSDNPLEELESISRIIVEDYSSIYQHRQRQSLPCLLSLGGSLLLNTELPRLPGKHYILDVAADCQFSVELLQRLKQLTADGHRLAVSDFDPDIHMSSELLTIAKVVRVDIAREGMRKAARIAVSLRPHRLILLADNIDDIRQFRACADLGFHWFRGEFLGKSTPVQGRKIGSNKLPLIQILAVLQDSDSSLADLGAIVVRDASLTFRLLRVVNAAGLGLGKPIATLSQALNILGTDQLRRWVCLLLVNGCDNKPAELMRKLLIRARMAELIAEMHAQAQPQSHFIAGLFSQLDELMDIPMEELMQQVALAQDIKEALLYRHGDIGASLMDVENYEKGLFHKLRSKLRKSFYETAYRHSHAWARQIQETL